MADRIRPRSLPIVGSVAVAALLLIALVIARRADDSQDTLARVTVTDPTSTITAGHLDVDTGSFLAIEVTLRPGDAIRYRIEPGPELAAEILLLTDRATVRQRYETLWPRIPEHLRPDSVEEIIDGIGRDSRSALNPGRARSAFGDRDVIASEHPGLPGEYEVTGGRPIAQHHIALAQGEYIVLAQAVSGGDEARLVVEVARRLVEDLEAYLAHPTRVLSDDPWFEEHAFFRDTTPWSPAG